MHSRWTKVILQSGGIRGVGVQLTDVVVEACKRQKRTGREAKALGEALLAGVFLSSSCKSGEVINLTLEGSGWAKRVFVDADGLPQVRGYLISAEQEGAHASEALGPWGEGFLSVLRTKGGVPYRGTIPMLTGHLAKDLAYYWHQSEQISTAVGIDVELSSDGQEVKSAYGFLVQVMPGASDEEIAAVESHLSAASGQMERFRGTEDPLGILANLFQEESFTVLDTQSIALKCPCDQKRVESVLSVLPDADLKELQEDDQAVGMHCDFCAKDFFVSQERLAEILNSRS